MKAAELRQSILQAAVRGKLVPQNPEDEPAFVLLERVKQKKNQFLKKNGIKDEKPLPLIATDEYPYVLPQGWIWCRLGDLGVVQSSKRVFTSDFVNQGIPFYRGTEVGALSTGKSVIPKYYITEEHYTELVHHTGKPMVGDLLMPSICPDGRIWQVDTDAPFYFKDGRVLWVRFPEDSINNHYVQQALKARLLSDYKDIASGTTFAELKIFLLREIVIALPPLAEQNRIVTKINGLFALCDELESEEKKMDALEAHFTEYLPKSILQEAVQGKLVPQDAHDEPASELLKKVCLKRKPQSVEEDAVPFDIPDSWRWTYISDIGELMRGSGIKRNETVAQGLPCVRYGEIYTTYDTAFSKTVSFIPKSLFDKCKQIKSRDVLMTLTGENKPDIAKAIAYLGTAPVAIGGDLVCWTNHGMNPLYLSYLMASPYAINQKIRFATGDMIVHISGNKLGIIPIPIPPLAEQNRIVAKIEELFALCSEMRAAYTEPVEFDKVSEIISFPAPPTIEQTEESVEPLLLAARGDAENLSSEALKAIDNLFAEDTE